MNLAEHVNVTRLSGREATVERIFEVLNDNFEIIVDSGILKSKKVDEFHRILTIYVPEGIF